MYSYNLCPYEHFPIAPAPRGNEDSARPPQRDRLADLVGPLDRTFLHHVAAVVSPTRERRQLVHPVGLENLAAAVNQDRIVVAAQGFVGPLVLPHALDDLRGIQDVSEAEHAGRM